jgi:hypothetical protein
VVERVEQVVFQLVRDPAGPLEDAGVNHSLHGRPALRARAISASETGRCFRRKSSKVSIAAARCVPPEGLEILQELLLFRMLPLKP